jgi:hypothetical protein
MTYNVLETCMLFPGVNASDCASWVQAWGSIGAILVAVWVAHSQDRRSRRFRIETAVRESRTFVGALAAAAETMIQVAPNNSFGECRAVLAQIEEAIIDGRAIEHELLRMEWTIAIQALRSIAAQMAEQLRETKPEELQGAWQSPHSQDFCVSP